MSNHEIIELDCCQAKVKPDEHPVKYNPTLKLVQCHACGHVYIPQVYPPILVYKDTKLPVAVGQEVRIHDRSGKIIYFCKPHKPQSEGKVSILLDGEGFSREVYVSVIGAEWINRDDL